MVRLYAAYAFLVWYAVPAALLYDDDQQTPSDEDRRNDVCSLFFRYM